MRIGKRGVLAMVIGSLGGTGCAPDMAPTVETILSNALALEGSLWAAAAPMLSKRDAHAALKLQDGRILVVGGTTQPSEAAEYYDSAKDAWTPITIPNTIVIAEGAASCRPALAQQDNGTVIIVANDSVVAFDPSQDQWTPGLLTLPFTTCIPSAISLNNQVLILADDVGSTQVLPFVYQGGVVTSVVDLPTPISGNWHGFAAIRLNDGRVLVSGGDGNATTVLYDTSDPNKWVAAADMYYHRGYHAMALLPNGNVLAAGGSVVTQSMEYRNDTAEIFNVKTMQWAPTTSMLSLRSSNHTATSVGSGFVLVVGGSISSTAELFDASTSLWTSVESSTDARYFDHASTLLDDGRVLVTGGLLNDHTNEVSICDALAFAWESRTSFPAEDRAFHSATTLNDGTMLIAGGAIISENVYSNSLQDAWLYDPTLDTWTEKESSLSIHEFHSAAKLSNGHVLVAGGANESFAEIFDPFAITNSWSKVENSPYLSLGQTTATLLNDGRVLLLGAYTEDGSSRQVLLYEPTSNSWTVGPALPDDSLTGPGHSATLLKDNTVLVVGGFPKCPVDIITTEATSTSAVFDPVNNTWGAIASTNLARGFHSATLLPDTRVLIAGGGGEIANSCITPFWYSVLATAELYDPTAKTWTTTTSMTEARAEHRAILMDESGRVLVAGGRRNSQNRILSSAEIFDPIGQTWTATSRMQIARYGHSLTLFDGGVVTVGGVHPFATSKGSVERFPQLEQGIACTLNDQCKSKYCVDGVCCDSACNSQCSACSKNAPNIKTEKSLDDGICEDVSGCAPYACTTETGTCGKTCTEVDECATGYVCEPMGTCVEPLTNASQIDESGCSAASMDANGSSWASLAFVASIYALRRRKHQRKS
jgi:N-acetylneuraminic acid mutarotase